MTVGQGGSSDKNMSFGLKVKYRSLTLFAIPRIEIGFAEMRKGIAWTNDLTNLRCLFGTNFRGIEFQSC